MDNYKNQVSLLLNVLPEVAKESCFALHGGTAINLFVRDMPRLSVDIDLTYIPIEDRGLTFKNIVIALENIKKRLEKILSQAKITLTPKFLKLLVSTDTAQIKIEVNQINRGLLCDAVKLELCDKAQEEFDAFCVLNTVSFGQLYGGKICAALDRQHPRDLFDVKDLLENEGFTNEVKEGVILSLLSSNRPLNELLNPHLIDQQDAMVNQFNGMSNKPFTYEDFEATRTKLIKSMRQNLKDKDKEFLLSFNTTNPNWNIYDFEKFPAVQWKLQNLVKLKNENTSKYNEQIATLKKVLQ